MILTIGGIVSALHDAHVNALITAASIIAVAAITAIVGPIVSLRTGRKVDRLSQVAGGDQEAVRAVLAEMRAQFTAHVKEGDARFARIEARLDEIAHTVRHQTPPNRRS